MNGKYLWSCYCVCVFWSLLLACYSWPETAMNNKRSIYRIIENVYALFSFASFTACFRYDTVKLLQNAVRCRYNADNSLQNIHKKHPVTRPSGLWWVWTLMRVLLQPLQCCMKYHAISDRVITALACTHKRAQSTSARSLHRNGNVLRVSVPVVTVDVGACHQHSQWRSKQSPTRHCRFHYSDVMMRARASQITSLTSVY